MPITLTITAESGEDARTQILNFLNPVARTELELGFTVDKEEIDTPTRAAPAKRAQKASADKLLTPTDAANILKAQITETEIARPQPDAPAESEASSAAPSAPVSSGTAELASGEVSYEDVRAAILAVSDAHGREGVTSVLDQFGVTHANKVDPSLWGELVAAAKATLDQGDA